MLSSQVIRTYAENSGAGPVGRVRAGFGFTLIELLIAVGIVAILAAIAYPSYQSQVRKTRRADAKAVLMQNAQFMERVYTEFGCYKGACTGSPTCVVACDRTAANVALPSRKSPIDGSDEYYTISLTTLANDAFTLTATPVSSEGTAALTLDHTGARTGW
ncbi:type IV pilin protein [uncultured Thiodictyon sp.]|jgi:type IV pilus assembly protein PilE|uniref:type IV pilin protein n=1 Tax=uncultured Thiodictyon sp. TaxID=1846217 RepID=UPI0025D169BC|nr:type IV pilin protein [uncultured Thiodictyon sp.]